MNTLLKPKLDGGLSDLTGEDLHHIDGFAVGQGLRHPAAAEGSTLSFFGGGSSPHPLTCSNVLPMDVTS